MTLKTADLQAGLYLVATPIGNLRDMPQRGIDTLGAADLILCEDTRMTGKLLHAYGLKGRMEVYSDHTADRMRPKALAMIAEGQSVALVSDAGMPLISDPGYKLVRDAQDLGLYVTSVPGANAVLTALQLSGLPTDKFSFLGFLPPKQKARRDVLGEWADVPGTLVAYETAPRLIESLEDMAAVLGGREAAVVRELTKMHEEVRRDTLDRLASHYRDAGEPRGEIVVVIGPGAARAFSDSDLEAHLREALKTLSVRDAAAHVAEMTGVPRKKAYEFAIILTKDSDPR